MGIHPFITLKTWKQEVLIQTEELGFCLQESFNPCNKMEEGGVPYWVERYVKGLDKLRTKFQIEIIYHSKVQKTKLKSRNFQAARGIQSWD